MPEPTPNAPRHDPSPKSVPQPATTTQFGPPAWIWIVVVLVVGLAALIYFRHRQPEQQQPPGTGGRGAGGGAMTPTPMVSTVTSRKGDIGIYVNALGTVTPFYTVSVNSRVDGQIMDVHYEEGQEVKKGDPLIDIDPGPFQATETQAEGQLARDKALLENANVDLDRYKEAYAKNAIPKQQLDTQVATVHQDEGTVKIDEGTLENAKVQLGYTHITAPISGRVGLRLVDPGNIVHAANSNALVVITEMQPITVIFTVPEDNLEQILQQVRQNKTLEVDAFDRTQTKKLASGKLETLDNQIDPTTGTVKLRAIFSNEDNALFPNQFVNARLLVDTLRDATLVPNPVIQRDSQGAFVYLVNSDQTISTNPVVVKVTDGDTSAVEGLEPDTLLVGDNFNKLTDGMKVQVRKPGGGGHRGGGEQGSEEINNFERAGGNGQQKHRQQQ
jgi:multidrug efflux system membrane fusion protein